MNGCRYQIWLHSIINKVQNSHFWKSKVAWIDAQRKAWQLEHFSMSQSTLIQPYRAHLSGESTRGFPAHFRQWLCYGWICKSNKWVTSIFSSLFWISNTHCITLSPKNYKWTVISDFMVTKSDYEDAFINHWLSGRVESKSSRCVMQHFEINEESRGWIYD